MGTICVQIDVYGTYDRYIVFYLGKQIKKSQETVCIRQLKSLRVYKRVSDNILKKQKKIQSEHRP